MTASISNGGFAPAPSDRLGSVQALRALAALAVVYNHAVTLIAHGGFGMPASALGPSRAIGEIGGIGVDLFFVISGFVMAMGARRMAGGRDAMRFLALRWVRISPLYYFFAVFALLMLLRAGVTPASHSVLNTISFIPLLDGDHYSWPIHYLGWTLAFEFVFYLFVAAAITLGSRDIARALLVVLVALPVAGLLLLPTTILWRLATNPLMWEFAAGVVAYLLFSSGRLQSARSTLTLLALAACAWVVVGIASWPDEFAAVSQPGVIDGPRDLALQRVLYWGVPMSIVFAVCVAHGWGGGSSLTARGLRFIGDASYSLYLSHLLLIQVMVGLLKHVRIDTDVAIVLGVVLSVLLGAACYKWIELPVLRIGRRWVDRWMPAAGADLPRAATGTGTPVR